MQLDQEKDYIPKPKEKNLIVRLSTVIKIALLWLRLYTLVRYGAKTAPLVPSPTMRVKEGSSIVIDRGCGR